jgi:hypothetical protein
VDTAGARERWREQLHVITIEHMFDQTGSGVERPQERERDRSGLENDLEVWLRRGRRLLDGWADERIERLSPDELAEAVVQLASARTLLFALEMWAAAIWSDRRRAEDRTRGYEPPDDAAPAAERTSRPPPDAPDGSDR